MQQYVKTGLVIASFLAASTGLAGCASYSSSAAVACAEGEKPVRINVGPRQNVPRYACRAGAEE